MEKPFISVIVTAYNRKQFILEALNSIINQTLSRDKYEVIVTKNFEDKDIDKFISDNDMKNILFTEPGIGPRLVDAIKLCQGDVITFLEDDDIWSNNRLERVYDVFKNYNVGFYHNSSIRNKINEDYSGLVKQLGITDPNNYKIIDYKYKNKIYTKNWENNSSIAISKDLATRYIHEIYSSGIATDFFLFLIALADKKNLFIDFNRLTFIRAHERAKTLEEELEYEEKLMKNLLYGLDLAKRYKSHTGIDITKLQIFNWVTQIDILKKTKKAKLIKDALDFFPAFKLINGRVIKKIALILIYLIKPGYAKGKLVARLGSRGRIKH